MVWLGAFRGVAGWVFRRSIGGQSQPDDLRNGTGKCLEDQQLDLPRAVRQAKQVAVDSSTLGLGGWPRNARWTGVSGGTFRGQSNRHRCDGQEEGGRGTQGATPGTSRATTIANHRKSSHNTPSPPGFLSTTLICRRSLRQTRGNKTKKDKRPRQGRMGDLVLWSAEMVPNVPQEDPIGHVWDRHDPLISSQCLLVASSSSTVQSQLPGSRRRSSPDQGIVFTV